MSSLNIYTYETEPEPVPKEPAMLFGQNN